jgi:hypothetical protein
VGAEGQVQIVYGIIGVIAFLVVLGLIYGKNGIDGKVDRTYVDKNGRVKYVRTPAEEARRAAREARARRNARQ